MYLTLTTMFFVKSAISSTIALPHVTECLFSREVGMDKGDLGTKGLSEICHILTLALLQ